MRKFGIIGYPLGHSFSPPYFSDKFQRLGITDAEYKAYPLSSIEEFPSLISEQLVGLNVTIPYKESVMRFLHSLSPAASEIKADSEQNQARRRYYATTRTRRWCLG